MPIDAAVQFASIAAGALLPVYANPVSVGVTDTSADPAVIRAKDGHWYAYGTTDTVREFTGSLHYLPILRSDDLITWTHIGDVFEPDRRPAWHRAGGRHRPCALHRPRRRPLPLFGKLRAPVRGPAGRGLDAYRRPHDAGLHRVRRRQSAETARRDAAGFPAPSDLTGPLNYYRAIPLVNLWAASGVKTTRPTLFVCRCRTSGAGAQPPQI